MKTTHTPGPWATIDGDGEYIIKTIAPAGRNGYTIADVFSHFEATNPEAEANARLIASAPELLEALQECVKALELEHEIALSLTQSRAVSKAKQAINKATEGR